jgi:hypothetical protein
MVELCCQSNHLVTSTHQQTTIQLQLNKELTAYCTRLNTIKFVSDQRWELANSYGSPLESH